MERPRQGAVGSILKILFYRARDNHDEIHICMRGSHKKSQRHARWIKAQRTTPCGGISKEKKCRWGDKSHKHGHSKALYNTVKCYHHQKDRTFQCEKVNAQMWPVNGFAKEIVFY